MYAAAEMSMNSVERVGECESSPADSSRARYSIVLIWLDLDLEVEEEEHSRGIEPPAYWPSRDSTVKVEDLTCHYAPQVCRSLLAIGTTYI